MVIDSLPTDIFHLFEERGVLIKAEKGSQIYLEGEKAKDLFLIKTGSVQISKETANAKELTFRICGKNRMIGECTLFTPDSIHSTTAKASTQCELLALNKNSLEMVLTQKPALMVEYLKWLQNENLKNQSLLRDLLMHGKKGALYSTLIRLANTHGEKLSGDRIYIDTDLTNTDIANLCSTSREMINRMLNDLKKQEVITFDKSNITILNLQFLKDEICCDNCPSAICRID